MEELSGDIPLTYVPVREFDTFSKISMKLIGLYSLIALHNSNYQLKNYKKDRSTRISFFRVCLRHFLE